MFCWIDRGWKVLRIDGGFALQATMLEEARVPLCCIENKFLHERAAEIGPVLSIELLQLQHKGATPELHFAKGY